MAADSYEKLEKESYTLIKEHDLIIRVVEHKKVKRTEGDGNNQRTVSDSVPTKVHDLKVKRDTLVNAAEYFKKLINGGFKENQQSTIELMEDSAESANGVVVWLKILHGSVIKSSYSISILGVWEVLAAAHKYGLDPKSKRAKAWFQLWYHANKKNLDGTEFDFTDYECLLFPCHAFDHAEGFAATTKYLAYHAIGHITERRPDGFEHDHLRLESSVIPKGRLKTILHRVLYDPIDQLLKKADCDCKERVLYSYEKSLSKTGAWPLETAYLRQSMTEILRKLDDFEAKKVVMPSSCSTCNIGSDGVVARAIAETETYFDGLCLDCMDVSKPKFRDGDEDYWRHAEQRNWDRACRIAHKQPTWYFSFMGRRQKMVEWTQRNRERSREHWIW